MRFTNYLWRLTEIKQTEKRKSIRKKIRIWQRKHTYADEVGGSSDTESALCGHCLTQVVDGISCDFCERWFHYKECSEVRNAENKILENEHILYVYDDCNIAKKSRNEMQKTNCSINNKKLNEIEAQFSQMYDKMNNMVQVRINKEETDENKRVKSYTEKIKNKE